MTIVWQLIYLLLWFFRLFLLARIVVEFVRVIARQWRPAGRSTVVLELLYVTTDPPVKLFRRLIPSVRLGGVGFDLSVLVLFLAVWIAMSIVSGQAVRTY